MNKFIRYIPLSVCLPTDMVGSTPMDQRTLIDAVYLVVHNLRAAKYISFHIYGYNRHIQARS